MKWILILIVFGFYGNGVTTAEFNTKEACMFAGQAIPQMRPKERVTLKYPQSVFTCVPKGDLK